MKNGKGDSLSNISRPNALGKGRSRRGSSRSSVRSRILNSATTVFGAESFHRATVREIARGAGLGLGTIYDHFPSKEAVLIALMTDKFTELGGILRQSIEGIDSPLEKLRKFTWAFLHFFEEDPNMARIVYLVVPMIKWSGSEYFYAMNEPHRILLQIVTDGQERGCFRRDIDLRVLIYTYFGGLARLIVSREFETDEPTPLAFVPNYYEMTLRGIVS